MSKKSDQNPEGIQNFLSMLSKSLEKENRDKLVVGDKVILNNWPAIIYFIPKDTNISINKEFKRPNKHLIKYFKRATAIVVEINYPFDFNCRHCSNVHSHDILVNYPDLGITYHATESDFSLVDSSEE